MLTPTLARDVADHRRRKLPECLHSAHAPTVVLFGSAVATTPDDEPDRSMCFNNLGNKLERRYNRTGARPT